MKAKAIIEFVVFMDSLKTIGIFLLDEGMYQIRINLYIQSSQNLKIPLTPKETLLFKRNEQQYLPQHIIDNFYMSDAFLLRQWTEEEKFEIKNGCRFSGAIPHNLKEQPCYMEIELMYYDLAQKIVSFQSISMAKFKIENSSNGIYEYVPVILGEDHFSLLNLIVLCSLTSFDIQIQQVQNEDKKAGDQHQNINMRQLYNKVLEPLKTCYRNMQTFYYNMELEMERPSSKGGMQYHLRQTKSFQILPLSSADQLLKNEQNTQLISKVMANEFKVLQSTINQLWHKIIIGLKLGHQKILRQLKKESLTNFQSRYSAFTQKEVIPVVDHQYTMIPQQQKQSQEQADLQNKRLEYQKLLLQGPSKIVDLKIIDEIKDKLMIVEKHYVTRQTFQLSRSKLHLIVLVHGYQGHSYDMRLLENYMCLRFPQHMLLVSLCNQQNTEGDILQMGKYLSDEIKNYIATWSYTDKLVISFIGHSLGGLIIRAALPYLDFEFHTLLTLGTPHLGNVTNQRPLIKFGMWFFQKLKKSQSLSQLNCYDDTLLKLSLFPGMNKFKHIILFGSQQDHYVNSESSLLMKVSGIENEQKHNEMATNILRQLHQNEVLRISIDYKFYDGDFDTFLGRKAHIAILESHFLNQYIIYNLGDYFK
ncbi:unnamed protein product [Paramecium pentaurelia]|uniref:DUF676 domain-containing protein n=1 Tax=Paramecium pentaurelia TaxID=43138 RepID=A0A8S1SVZ9_9CILI|nr:unnamed protein product [Paramecium pentaurelia]